ncbi:hypothetical protein BH11BAC1_BH11BAC1_21570 [soil metagenome]
MKKFYTSFIIVLSCWYNISSAQMNYLDNYIGSAVTLTIVGSSTDQLSQPRDLDFKPNTNELWVINYGNSDGGNTVIFYNAGLSNQTSEYRKDTHTSHFMIYPSAMAFGDDGKWAAVSEIQNTAGASSTFMGPALWLSDTNIFARIFQNNWISGYPLGSHVDMLHQSPYAMGIAHDTATAYWVMDGHNGNICKYDFVNDHGPGYDNHSAGKIWRYSDVLVTRVPQVPSHMVLDKATGWLYFIDGGPKQIKRMNTNTGTVTGNLVPPSTGSETLALYKEVEFATVETLATLTSQPCGIDYYKNRLIVSDFTTGDIKLYSTDSAFTLLQTIQTGHPGMMGVKIGPDGHIWCVNKTESKVYRLDVAAPTMDVSIRNITSPQVENCLLYQSSFFSPTFNICSGSIMPTIEVANNGTSSVTDMEIHYMIDGGVHTVYNWTGSLAAGNTTSISLPASSVSNGSHVLDIMIMMVNGMEDDIDLNNMMSGSFRSFNAPVIQPFIEGFTIAMFPPAGWNYVHYNKFNFMSRAAAGGFGGSTGSMKMDNYSGTVDISDQKDYLITPIIDMTTAGSSSMLRFNIAHARYNNSTSDQFQVLASSDCGSSWTIIYDKSGATLSTAPVTTSAFTPTATQWRIDSVSLAAYSGSPELLLAFTSTSNFGNNVYVDDIFVGDLFTGITEAQSSNSILVFPNPVANQMTISAQFDIDQIEMYDLIGRKMLSQNLSETSEKKVTIDVSEFPSGVYFLYVNQKGVTKKIVIQ